MSKEIPKAKSEKFLKLWQHLSSIFDPTTLTLISLGVIDRSRAELLLTKISGGTKKDLRNLEREKLYPLIISKVVKDREAAYELLKELDRSTKTQRTLITSIPPGELEDRLGGHRALLLRRHGAKLIWALARDHRQEAAPLAVNIVREYIKTVEKIENARAKTSAKDTADGLKEFEALFNTASVEVEKLEAAANFAEEERAHLLAEIGRREAALRAEAKKRERLARELGRLRDGPPVVSKPPQQSDTQSEDDIEKLKNKLRKYEKSNTALLRQLGELEKVTAAASKLELENKKLRASLEMLRQSRAVERQDQAKYMRSERSGSVPLVEPPNANRRRKTKNSDEDKVGVFLDIANLAGAARRLFKASVDYQQLLTMVLANRRAIELRAYAIDKGEKGYKTFASSLRTSGFKVFGKKPKEFSDGTIKADWDLGIAVDILSLVDKFDVVVLGTGDGDFLPLVSDLQRRGVRVELATFKERAAAELLAVVDQIYVLDQSVLT